MRLAMCEMFRAAEIMILNGTDLLPHIDFDVACVIANARGQSGDDGTADFRTKRQTSGKLAMLVAPRNRQD
jgi:Ni2+-binding GTPase involved in maturation of urease and hydrogenase